MSAWSTKMTPGSAASGAFRRICFHRSHAALTAALPCSLLAHSTSAASASVMSVIAAGQPAQKLVVAVHELCGLLAELVVRFGVEMTVGVRPALPMLMRMLVRLDMRPVVRVGVEHQVMRGHLELRFVAEVAAEVAFPRGRRRGEAVKHGLYFRVQRGIFVAGCAHRCCSPSGTRS